MTQIYDTIIIGGGPAGLSAGLYAARGKMNVLIIEAVKFGGQITGTEEIENYPGSIEECTGTLLSKRIKKQAEEFGAKFSVDEVVDISLEGNTKIIKGKKETYESKTVIICTGAKPRLGGFKRELELRGKGIAYCATCDADFFTDLDVAVVGGGDSAVKEAIYLTKFAKHVTIIHRRDLLRASKSLQEKAFNNPKISFIWNSAIEEAVGDHVLEKLIVKNKITSELSELKVDGCFVFVGYEPVTEVFEGKLSLEKGYILTDEDMRTNMPGVFAAGDVRKKSLRQAITAAADGAIAATVAEQYIDDHN